MEFNSIHRENILTCPITHEIFRDPVLAGDGHVYERAAIIEWITEKGTSPITSEPLHVDDLLPEDNIKRLCQQQLSPVTYTARNQEVDLFPLHASQFSNVNQQRPIPSIVQRTIENNNRNGFNWCTCIAMVLVVLIIVAAVSLFAANRSSSKSFFHSHVELR